LYEIETPQADAIPEQIQKGSRTPVFLKERESRYDALL
jgi:hypothetical protein